MTQGELVKPEDTNTNVKTIKSYHLAHAIMCQKYDTARKLFDELATNIHAKAFKRYGLSIYDAREKVFADN